MNTSRLLCLLASSVFFFIAHSVQAGFVSGNDLKKYCEPPQEKMFPGGACLGFILGVVDTDSLRGSLDDEIKYICLAKQVTGGQLLAMVRKFMNDNPQELHLPGAAVVTLALAKHFPCN